MAVKKVLQYGEKTLREPSKEVHKVSRKIQELVQQKPDITLQEIIDTLQLKICIETVRKALIKLGYSYKKKSLHASEQERPRCTGETPLMERDYVWHKC